jgi:hypothetical protein
MDKRKEMVLAMELLVRSVNNEELIMPWLSCGVPDGDIERFEEDEVDEYFTQDKEFAELMGLFLKIMVRAYKDGGLYADGVTSKEG